MKIKRLTLFFLYIVSSTSGTWAQHIVVKTNVLYGAWTRTPNLGVEIGVDHRITFNLAGSYNPWSLHGSETDNKKLVHWLAQPEFRYWLRQRFNGHFIGAHALGGQFNIAGYHIPHLFEKQFRYQGWTVGGGISYGYNRIFTPRWGVEFTVGAGIAHINYDKYQCNKCDGRTGKSNKIHFGPTKAGITLIYMIK